MLRDLAFIALAGATGALCRYGSDIWASRLFGRDFAYGTFIVNITGCFLLGLLTQYSAARGLAPKGLLLAVTVGFLGSFTTFSTFGVQTMTYVSDGQINKAVLNVGAQVCLGLLAAWFGLRLGRLWTAAH